MSKPTIKTKVETKKWILSSVFLTTFNRRQIFKNHFFSKIVCESNHLSLFRLEKLRFIELLFWRQKKWVPKRHTFFRKIRNLVGKPFFFLKKSNYLEKLKIFLMKVGRQRVSIPVPVGYMAALLLLFSFLQATSSYARFCISWYM